MFSKDRSRPVQEAAEGQGTHERSRLAGEFEQVVGDRAGTAARLAVRQRVLVRGVLCSHQVERTRELVQQQVSSSLNSLATEAARRAIPCLASTTQWYRRGPDLSPEDLPNAMKTGVKFQRRLSLRLFGCGPGRRLGFGFGQPPRMAGTVTPCERLASRG